MKSNYSDALKAYLKDKLIYFVIMLFVIICAMFFLDASEIRYALMIVPTLNAVFSGPKSTKRILLGIMGILLFILGSVLLLRYRADLFYPVLRILVIVPASGSVLLFTWDMLVFPLDMIHGTCKKECYYSRYYSTMYNFEFFRGYTCYTWRFYTNMHELIQVNCPISESEELSIPPRGKKLIVTYYKHSKIMMGWELA